MRKQATIIRWDGTRGFGFMRSADTPADVFFHVKDWGGGSERPIEGLAVVYEEIHVGGKGPRGVAVRPAAMDRAPAVRRATRPVRRGSGADGSPAPALLLMVLYAVLLGWAAHAGRLSVGVALATLPLSFVTFLAYWRDKSAAERGAWRTSEQALHGLSLVGGWPGAWFAQRLLRHKSRKASFRAAYWGTVAVHWFALGAWIFAR
jgi:uncharacterized membrane protein YsdA (DUF1294 family)/cold shock CspA family protein